MYISEVYNGRVMRIIRGRSIKWPQKHLELKTRINHIVYNDKKNIFATINFKLWHLNLLSPRHIALQSPQLIQARSKWNLHNCVRRRQARVHTR